MARILIIEDNPDNMKLFTAILGHGGHEITGLYSGEGLLEALDNVKPDLVLMDIQLPGRDGFELLAEIRKSPWAAVRVLALTAHAMTGDREKAKKAGFDDYITKPIDIASFSTDITRALAGQPLDRQEPR
jgi:CheY-like chemotaxis protein